MGFVAIALVSSMHVEEKASGRAIPERLLTMGDDSNQSDVLDSYWSWDALVNSITNHEPELDSSVAEHAVRAIATAAPPPGSGLARQGLWMAPSLVPLLESSTLDACSLDGTRCDDGRCGRPRRIEVTQKSIARSKFSGAASRRDMSKQL